MKVFFFFCEVSCQLTPILVKFGKFHDPMFQFFHYFSTTHLNFPYPPTKIKNLTKRII